VLKARPRKRPIGMTGDDCYHAKGGVPVGKIQSCAKDDEQQSVRSVGSRPLP
jgi:hypothetical protein